MSALGTARRGALLHSAGVSGAVTRQVASVVRTAGVEAVRALGSGVLTDETGGEAMQRVLCELERLECREAAELLTAASTVQDVIALPERRGQRAVAGVAAANREVPA